MQETIIADPHEFSQCCYFIAEKRIILQLIIIKPEKFSIITDLKAAESIEIEISPICLVDQSQTTLLQTNRLILERFIHQANPSGLNKQYSPTP